MAIFGFGSKARPKIPSLPCPRRELVRGVGTGRWSVPGDVPQKKLRLGGSLVRGMQPLSPQLLPCSCRLSRLFVSGALSARAALPSRRSGISIWAEFLRGRKNCRSDEPSGISNKIQMGEFSQTTCIARRSGQSSISASGCWGSSLAPNPRSGSHRDAQRRHGQLLEWVKNHRACAASISDPHHFSLSVLPGTSVSTPPVAAADECISSASTTTLDEGASTNICVLLSPIIHIFQPSRNPSPNLEAKWNRARRSWRCCVPAPSMSEISGLAPLGAPAVAASAASVP